MAADDSNTGASRKQVFISYSRTPSENVEFVRDLAGRLIVAGFSVWLDEEQIPAGADIKRMITKAAQQSEVGLFVVTERWVDRPWTQHEVNLFGERPDARLLVVRREETDTGDLGPHLAALRRVDWPEGDGDPDARFWEIYCEITDTAPGRHSEWAEKGRRVVFARTEAPTAEARTQSRPSAKSSVPRISLPRVTAPPRSKADIVLPCAGKPVSHFAGERWTFLVTDLEEWIGVAADGELFPPMGRLVEHSAALVGASNELLVGTYDPMIVRLRGTHWEYQPQESAVLCFTSSPEGFVGGTASGAIVMFGEHDGGPICRMRDPVMGLAYCDHAIMALGAQGMFGRIAWPPRNQETLRSIENSRPRSTGRLLRGDRVELYRRLQRNQDRGPRSDHRAADHLPADLPRRYPRGDLSGRAKLAVRSAVGQRAASSGRCEPIPDARGPPAARSGGARMHQGGSARGGRDLDRGSAPAQSVPGCSGTMHRRGQRFARLFAGANRSGAHRALATRGRRQRANREPMMPTVRLSQVNWGDAIASAGRRTPQATVLAPLLSLSALYLPEYESALSQVRHAARIDPFNPLHELRRALLLARFGDLGSASATLMQLGEQGAKAPVIDYLRAVFALRDGRPDQARAIAATLETSYPSFVYAKFLRAETQIVSATNPGRAERFLLALPTGVKWDPLWADLLIKLVLLHQQEGVTLAKKHLDKKVSSNSTERAMVWKAIAWVEASIEELARHLAAEEVNSRGEALVLECLMEKLGQGTAEAAVAVLTALHRSHPERHALRRVHHAFLTRRARQLASGMRYEEAMRLVELCMREQPHDAIYHQNRAALFTLLREPELLSPGLGGPKRAPVPAGAAGNVRSVHYRTDHQDSPPVRATSQGCVKSGRPAGARPISLGRIQFRQATRGHQRRRDRR